MRILAIESTCDETAAAVVESCGGGVKVLTNVVASSAEMYHKYGGIVPEVAAREQVMSIIPVISEALSEYAKKIDGVAVSYGPGLMGSLLIGAETAKVLSWCHTIPLYKVNHMAGHILANWIVTEDKTAVPEFPAIGLVVSGGHTDIVLMHNLKNWQWVGGTRDDAVGEAFDKAARIIGLPYPGGPEMDKAAKKVSDFEWQKMGKELRLPRPMINDGTLDMSFSGIKAATARVLEKNPKIDSSIVNLLSREFSEAVIEVLSAKIQLAIEKYSPRSVLLAGGVAANTSLRERLKIVAEKFNGLDFFVPELKYCGDNASMVGAVAILAPSNADITLKPNPSLQTVQVQPSGFDDKM